MSVLIDGPSVPMVHARRVTRTDGAPTGFFADYIAALTATNLDKDPDNLILQTTLYRLQLAKLRVRLAKAAAALAVKAGAK